MQPEPQQRREIEDDSQVLSRTCREVRLTPEKFSAGLAFIEREFSVETLRAQSQAELDSIDRQYPDGRPPIARIYESRLQQAEDPLYRVRTLQDWVQAQNMSMGVAEAQAVLLVAGWLADADPDWSKGLPALLDGWLAAYWKRRKDKNRRERLEQQRGALGMLRYNFAHRAKFRSTFAHICRLAWDRLEAQLVPSPSKQPRGDSKAGGNGGSPKGETDLRWAPDFTWIVVRGTSYGFSRGQQTAVIRALFETWESSGCRDGHGLTEDSLGSKAGSASSRFRIQRLFQKHPALGAILASPGKGKWALYLNAPPPDSRPENAQGMDTSLDTSSPSSSASSSHARKRRTRRPRGDGPPPTRPRRMAKD
jgi:hypothetical protein